MYEYRCMFFNFYIDFDGKYKLESYQLIVFLRSSEKKSEMYCDMFNFYFACTCIFGLWWVCVSRFAFDFVSMEKNEYNLFFWDDRYYLVVERIWNKDGNLGEGGESIRKNGKKYFIKFYV